MNQKEYELLTNIIGRTSIIISLEGNAIKRQAKKDALRLFISDLIGTLKSEYRSFDEAKFLAKINP